MVSMHLHHPHVTPAATIWGLILGVAVVPTLLLGGLFLLVKDVLIR